MPDLKGPLLLAAAAAIVLLMVPTGAAQSSADLIVDDIRLSPKAPDRGDEITLKAHIVEQGDGDYSQSYTVIFEANGTEIDRVEGQAVDFVTADEQTVSATQPWRPGVGIHDLGVRIDANDANQTNNTRNETLRLGPDLTFTSFTLDPAEPVEGDDVEAKVEVENVGNWNTTTAPVVTFTVDGSPTAQTHMADPLDPGDSRTVTLGPWTAEPGPHTFGAAIDVAGDINETSIQNNTIAGPTVEIPEIHPNLVVRQIVTQPIQPADGDTVTIQATVRNTGDEAAGASKTRLTIDGTPLAQLKDTDALDPGAQTAALWQWEATVGVHELGASADAADAVNESSEDDNGANRTLIVGPDLVTSDLTIDPDAPAAGENLTVSADLGNRGASVDGNLSVALVIDGQTVQTRQVNGAPAGSNQTLTFDPVNATEGTHTIAVVADANGTITEADEENNRVSERIKVDPGRPDLVVTSLRLTQDAVEPGETARFEATVRNTGADRARDVRVLFLVDGNQLGNTTTVGDLKPGNRTTTGSANWTAEAGAHTLTVRVDPGRDGGRITEADETNNRATLPFAIGPDLTVERISLDPETPRLGENVTVTSRIGNLGTQATGPFQVNLAVDGEIVAEATESELAARGTTTVELIWPGAEDADALTVTVDARDEVDEVEEANNERTANLTIDSDIPDLSAGSLTADPGSPAPGENVTFTLEIVNEGAADAGAFEVAFSVNGSSIGTSTVESLAAGANTSVTSPAWMATGSSTNVTARIDPGGAVPEGDTADNVARLALRVTEPESGLPSLGAPLAIVVSTLAAAAWARREA